MAASVIYQVEPKQVDADGNEFILPSYTIQSTDKSNNKQEFSLANTTGVYTNLDTTTAHTTIELQSDQPIDIDIMNSSGDSLLTLTATKNLLWTNTSGKTYTYKITNGSGTAANIVWRLYV